MSETDRLRQEGQLRTQAATVALMTVVVTCLVDGDARPAEDGGGDDEHAHLPGGELQTQHQEVAPCRVGHLGGPRR